MREDQVNVIGGARESIAGEICVTGDDNQFVPWMRY
jgi:hypothetical protein